jgi:hypothetical protein
LKQDRIDITKERYSFWLPNMGYTEINDQTNSTEVTYLYPDGKIIFYRKMAITYTCPFRYEMIPNDHHYCASIGYIQNANTDQVELIKSKIFNKNTPKYFTWSFDYEIKAQKNVQTSSGFQYQMSGVELEFYLKRNPSFLLMLFMFPSLMFTILAYASFYIDKNVAPARVTMCITNILNAISLLTSTNKYIPNVPYQTWLVDFLTWNLIFTIVPMIQFAILNSTIMTYNSYNSKINNLIQDIKASIDKEKDLSPQQANIPMQVINKSQKKISLQVRKQITGGDVI